MILAVMVLNITSNLRQVLDMGQEWSYLSFFECIESFKNGKLAVSYWHNEDSWMTLLNENNVVAYVWRKYPLIIVNEDYLLVVRSIIADKFRVISIPTPGMEKDVFQLDEDFDSIRFEFGFEKGKFSADDFWYYTNDSV